MGKWYIDKIKAVAPDLLDGDAADVLDWIDNAFAMYAEDADIAAKMDDAIKGQEEYFGVKFYCMSRTQLMTVVAKLMNVI
jgi:hypothetical protein